MDEMGDHRGLGGPETEDFRPAEPPILTENGRSSEDFDMETRPYARVYYVDLERDHPEVYRDNDLLSTWLRLLCVAEAMWPAVPEVPRSAKATLVRELVRLGLVILIAPYSFQVKGLDAERNARSNAARNAAASRWAMPSAMPKRTEPNQTKPSPVLSQDILTIDPQTQTPEEEAEAYAKAMERRTGVKL